MTYPFENDTRQIVRLLSKRSMEADKRRSFFVITTIALAVCLMATLCFIYSSQRLQTLEHIQGQYQAGCVNMSYEKMEQLVDAEKFEKWGYTVGVSSTRYKDSNLTVSFVDPGMIDLMDYGEVTGSYPQENNEICLERSFLENYDLSSDIGQTITLDLGYGNSPYILTGILETTNDSREYSVWVSQSAALSLNKSETPYELRFRFAGSQVEDTEQLMMDIENFFTEMNIPTDQTFFSSNYFDMANVYLGNGMEIYVLAILIAAVCAIVIYNIFYISVMGKMREYGRLKVLGATSKQLKRVVKRERRFLTITAIPVGFITASCITLLVMPGYWSWKNNILYAIAISLLTYLVVLIATRKPLQLVGKVSAIEAIRTTAYSQQQGHGISKQLHRRLTMMRLAVMNFSRNRKKAIVTALSLSLTGVLMICISAYANSVDAREMALSTFGDRSNYILEYEDYFGQDFINIQKSNPLDRTLQEQLTALSDVDYLTTYYATAVEIPEIRENEPFNIRGVTQEQMSTLYTDEAVFEGSANYQQLLTQNGILLAPGGSTLETVYGVKYNIGDTITLSSYNGNVKTYTIMGIVDDVSIGSSTHFFILPIEELSELYPEIPNFTSYINIHAKQDSEQLRKEVYETVTDNRINIAVLEDAVAMMEAGIENELTKYYGILIFIFVFSLINLANTLITNLLTRQQEFGIFQSVGMSNKQLSKMLSYECLLYVGITLIATLTVGTLCSIVICNIFNQVGWFGNITYHFPIIQVLIFAAALFLVQTMFAVYAIHYSKKLSLVDRIKAIE